MQMIFGRITSCSGGSAFFLGPASACRPRVYGYTESATVTRNGSLTGLANRVLLIERIRQAMSGSRHARPSHLFYLDLNGFKEVNDRFGHAAGDAVLTAFAHRITALLRAGDTAARLGGDEFAVLCEDTEPRHVSTIAERLRAAAAEPFLIDDAEIILSVAVGSSPAYVSPTYIADPAALLGEADRRMYETKQRTISVPVPAPRGTALTPEAQVIRSPITDLARGQGGDAPPAEWAGG